MIFISYGCKREQSRFSIPSSSDRKDYIIILNKLTSTDEDERFGVIEEAQRIIENMDINDIEVVLTSLRPKNISALVFVLMERQRDTLYKLNIPARKAVENSQGSFPNIAYYYARVDPKKGLPELLRLYKEHGEYRNQICKALGEVGTPEALNFLLIHARKEKKAGKHIISLLAGLHAYKGIISNKEILFFLEQQLDREEIILLSKLKTKFNQQELLGLWTDGNQKKLYAIEYTLDNPSSNFEVLKAIVDYELENNNWDYIIQLMMSDNIRRSEDEYIKKYRERIISKIREKEMGVNKNFK